MPNSVFPSVRTSTGVTPTATAISALIIHGQHGRSVNLRPATRFDPQVIYQSDLSQQVIESLHWLAAQQNEDGGWGDTDKSRSNIATTMLVLAAFHLTGVPAKYQWWAFTLPVRTLPGQRAIIGTRMPPSCSDRL